MRRVGIAKYYEICYNEEMAMIDFEMDAQEYSNEPEKRLKWRLDSEEDYNTALSSAEVYDIADAEYNVRQHADNLHWGKEGLDLRASERAERARNTLDAYEVFAKSFLTLEAAKLGLEPIHSEKPILTEAQAELRRRLPRLFTPDMEDRNWLYNLREASSLMKMPDADRRGITQKDLAYSIKYSHSHISYVERDEKDNSLEFTSRVLTFFSGLHGLDGLVRFEFFKMHSKELGNLAPNEVAVVAEVDEPIAA